MLLYVKVAYPQLIDSFYSIFGFGTTLFSLKP